MEKLRGLICHDCMDGFVSISERSRRMIAVAVLVMALCSFLMGLAVGTIMG